MARPFPLTENDPVLDQLAADVTAALSGQLRPAELIRALTFEQDGAGNQVATNFIRYPCEGVRADYDALTAGQSGIPRENARIELLAASLNGIEPQRGDVMEIEGEAFRIVNIERDAANALFVCECTLTDAPV